MSNHSNLERFIKAQESSYDRAFSEIKNGKKQSHWMWYIFPQIQGLGFSETSKYYAIRDKAEAEAFMAHAVLGPRLIAICQQLMSVKSSDAYQVFGSPDDMKLQSCLTLFASLPNANPVFQSLLKKYFDGEMDKKTLQILQHS